MTTPAEQALEALTDALAAFFAGQHDQHVVAYIAHTFIQMHKGS